MIAEEWRLAELYPGLETEAALTACCRSRTGLLADDGARWAVLILPGGGYARIAPAESEPVALAFAAAGVQAFTLAYSVLPARWPQPFLEGAAALAWMRGRAGDFGFRPDRVAVCGFSAGGHLAGSLACLWRDPILKDRLGLAPEQVRPNGAILCYPVVKEERFLAPVGAPRLDGRVPADHPPAFLWTTGADGTVPPENTLAYARALGEKGVPYELHLFQDGPHAMGLADRESARDEAHYDVHAAAWHGLCVDWLRRRG